MKFTEMFALLDSDQVGLVSFQAFLKNLDLIVAPPLAQAAKESLFSVMDTYKIGLISLEQIRRVINSTPVDLRMREKEAPKDTDSFEWVQEIIKSILDWITYKRLNLQEAFRVIDGDFDGLIREEDLTAFLKAHLGIELTEQKLSRLFCVLDLAKSGSIHLVDFERLFSDVHRQQKRGRAKSATGYSLAWEKNCLAQLAKHLQQHFADSETAFNSKGQVSHVTDLALEGKLNSAGFLDYLAESGALRGFSLSRELQLRLFASLDCHRKGFLTLQDWLRHFGKPSILDTY